MNTVLSCDRLRKCCTEVKSLDKTRLDEYCAVMLWKLYICNFLEISGTVKAVYFGLISVLRLFNTF